MRVEYAEISLLGGREENQDRVAAVVAEHAALLLVCTDGLWGSLKDPEIVAELGGGGALRQKLLTLGERAVKRAGGASDNTSAAALRWLGGEG